MDFRSFLAFVKDCGLLKGARKITLDQAYHCFTGSHGSKRREGVGVWWCEMGACVVIVLVRW